MSIVSRIHYHFIFGERLKMAYECDWYSKARLLMNNRTIFFNFKILATFIKNGQKIVFLVLFIVVATGVAIYH